MYQTWTVQGETTAWAFVWMLACISLFKAFLFYGLRSKDIISKKTFGNLMALLFSLVIAMLVGEGMLRFTAKDLRSYGERNGSPNYNTPYKIYLHTCDSCDGRSYFINDPNGHEEFYKPEFHYDHKYNSLGLRDKQFKVAKDSNEYRILGLGDSFTEGVGTSQDSTWLKQLEYRLNNDTVLKKHYTTMNGGAHGSDLFFSYDLLAHCLLKYKPDAVILNLNSTDINDIVFRGAYERYDAKGNFVGKKGPWWEPLFGSSYLVRLVTLKALHYNWQLMSAHQQQDENEKAYKAISQKIDDYQALAQKNGFEFFLVLQPLKEELKPNTNILENIRVPSSVKYLDLTHQMLMDQLVSLTQEKATDYYWPIDGHFTTRGYKMEGEAIYGRYFSSNADRWQ